MQADVPGCSELQAKATGTFPQTGFTAAGLPQGRPQHFIIASKNSLARSEPSIVGGHKVRFAGRTHKFTHRSIAAEMLTDKTCPPLAASGRPGMLKMACRWPSC